MDYGRAELADRLAASYVAGTLRGPARRRFEALLPAHAALRGATRSWQERLMPLTVAIPPETPPPRVWKAIQSQMDGALGAPQAAPKAGWGAAVALWRGLSAVLGIATVSLAVLLARPSPVQPPVIVVLSSTGSPAGATPSTIVASISGDGRSMVTKPLMNVSVQNNRALELWAIPPGGAPRSLGLISPSDPTVLRKGKSLEGTDTLAVSLEPAGGSPTGAPTGPVLYAGKFTL
ncbi:MAG: anti-sigma factor [Caldimonas sp.]